MTADCPICDTSVTVPTQPSAKKGRRAEGGKLPEGRHEHKAGATPAPGSLRSPFADPLPGEIREELIDASLINGKLVRDLEKAREEVARLQQQLKVLGDESERLKSSTTHTKAELKTFQTERQQLKAEVSSFRQKFTVAEEALAAREKELNEARGKAAAGIAAAELGTLETRLRETERAAEWEAKAGEAQQQSKKSAREASEWKAKARTAEAALAKLTARVEGLDAEVKAAALALQRMQKAAADSDDKVAAMEQALAAGVPELESAHTRAATLEEDLHKTQGRLGEVEAALASARQEELRLTTEHVEMQRQVDDAKCQFASIADLQAQLARADAELCDHREKLWLSEESNQSLATRCEQLRREADSLRRDVTESHSGRELMEARSRLEDAVAERDRTAARLSAVEADLHSISSAEAALRAELDQARHERDEAVERAESLRETRAAKDNQVLRGIIARLNGDLAQRTSEVLRAKRARVGLKIAYILFGVGLLGVIAFAVKVLPQALRH